MDLINLTPHPIVFRTPNGDVVLPTSTRVARVKTTRGAIWRPLDGSPVPIFHYPVYGAIEGLPPPCEVFAPGTGPEDEAVRDADGKIVAVTRLIAAPPM
jgi:hypothetical protein